MLVRSLFSQTQCQRALQLDMWANLHLLPSAKKCAFPFGVEMREIVLIKHIALGMHTNAPNWLVSSLTDPENQREQISLTMPEWKTESISGSHSND